MEWPRDLDTLTFDELIALFFGSVPEAYGGEESATGYYNDVGYAIGERGKTGRAFLLDQRERVEKDEARLGAVLLGVSLAPPDPATRALLHPYLQDTRALVVMHAVEALRRQKAGEVHDEILALLSHPSPYVRGAVLRYLQDLSPEEAIPYSLAALHDPDYVVRESAIDVLDELPDVAALPFVRPFLGDPHPDVRQAAETAVEHFDYLLTHPEDMEERTGARSTMTINKDRVRTGIKRASGRMRPYRTEQ